MSFMHRALAAAVVWGTIVAATAAPVGDFTDVRAAILAAHNTARAEVGTPPLTWSDALTVDAALWADKLAQRGRLEHAAPADRDGEGENLWMGTAGAYTTTEMIDGWLAEKVNFHPGVFPDVSKSGWQAVGHYTQMIWRGTTQVGCARARSGQWDVLVCRYAPAGNMVGEAAF